MQAQFGELDHKRKTADGGRSEIEVLKTKIATAEKVINDKNKALEKQAALVREEAKQEVDDLKKEQERALVNSQLEAKTQNEALKYKLQYLELSQKELEKEKKRWQEKEKEYERAIVNLTAESRELKLEHSQAIDQHEAYRVHVEAKESSKSLETSNFEIKKQSLVAEHQLQLKQAQATNNSRIQQLEREITRSKEDLSKTLEDNERLTLALESGSGMPEDMKRSAFSYEDDTPAQTREERKKEFEELAAQKVQVEPEETITVTDTVTETDTGSQPVVSETITTTETTDTEQSF